MEASSTIFCSSACPTYVFINNLCTFRCRSNLSCRQETHLQWLLIVQAARCHDWNVLQITVLFCERWDCILMRTSQVYTKTRVFKAELYFWVSLLYLELAEGISLDSVGLVHSDSWGGDGSSLKHETWVGCNVICDKYIVNKPAGVERAVYCWAER